MVDKWDVLRITKTRRELLTSALLKERAAVLSRLIPEGSDVLAWMRGTVADVETIDAMLQELGVQPEPEPEDGRGRYCRAHGRTFYDCDDCTPEQDSERCHCGVVWLRHGTYALLTNAMHTRRRCWTKETAVD